MLVILFGEDVLFDNGLIQEQSSKKEYICGWCPEVQSDTGFHLVSSWMLLYLSILHKEDETCNKFESLEDCGQYVTGLWETRNHDPPQSDDTHIRAIETELTYDYTYSQLPPIDYWTQ